MGGLEDSKASRLIPKNSRELVGPSVFLDAIGVPKSEKTSIRIHLLCEEGIYGVWICQGRL